MQYHPVQLVSFAAPPQPQAGVPAPPMGQYVYSTQPQQHMIYAQPHPNAMPPPHVTNQMFAPVFQPIQKVSEVYCGKQNRAVPIVDPKTLKPLVLNDLKLNTNVPDFIPTKKNEQGDDER